MTYKVKSKGQYREVTALISPELKNKIIPDLKLIGPVGVGATFEKIELSYSIEEESALVRFKIKREVNNISAIEVLIATAESLLTNFKTS
jgi:hypothetical protein